MSAQPVLAPTDEPDLLHDSPLAQVWHGDSRAVLAGLSAESVDLVLTDPPYGVAWESGYRATSLGQLHGDGADDASRAVISDVLTQCVRLVGQSRHLYVFGPDDVLDGQKVSETAQLVWDKGTMGTGNLAAPWGPAHEPITFCVSTHRHAGRSGKPRLAARLRKGSVLSFNRPTGRKVRHPSEKPVPLLRELIESSSRQGETVLDPFAGSGGTGVAALLSGRRAILVDSDPRWATLAAERVARAESLVGELAGI